MQRKQTETLFNYKIRVEKMKDDYFKIKDRCREGLIKYLETVSLKLPGSDTMNILDVGCGTGVATLWFAENFPVTITAIDKDRESIDYLHQKITGKDLQNRIKTICTSFFDFTCDSGFYDIILAEGFLNVVGFEAGFIRINEMLKRKGYLVIHDEYKDHTEKLAFIHENKCTLIDTLYLDEKVWWNDYYRQLEIEINRMGIPKRDKLFKRELEEIKYYKASPSLFRSIYYIIMKT